MIEDNRKRAQERKRKRGEVMNETSQAPTDSNRVSFAPPDEAVVAKQNQTKRVQMESIGFAISYADNTVDINDDELDELCEIEEMEKEMDSQFNRKMDDIDNGYYEY